VDKDSGKLVEKIPAWLNEGFIWEVFISPFFKVAERSRNQIWGDSETQVSLTVNIKMTNIRA